MEKHEKAFFKVNMLLGISGVLVGIVLSLIIILGIRSNLFRLTRKVSEVTQAISEGRSLPASNLEIKASDEIGELAQNLSQMINQVSDDFQKRDDLSRHLKQVATTDPLTGAFNRLKWEEDLALEVERVKRSKDELSSILFDIDYFKKVNDTYGHDIGDMVLIRVVEVVTAQIRQGDSLYRIGGEEFVILLPSTTREQAGVLAEKIRKEIQSTNFETVGTITISLGCVQFDKSTADATAMFKEADQALYRSKEEGRNRVTVSGG